MDDRRTLDELRPPNNEHVIGFAEAARICGVEVSTVYDWANKGKLEQWRLPNGRRQTTREAVVRALRRANPPPPRERRATRQASTKARREANRAELKRLGLLA